MRTKTESLRQRESKRGKELELSEVQGNVPMEPGNKNDEQVAVRHADASGGDIRETQQEVDRMRDIHVGKRGSEAAGEEQPDKLRKTARFELEASSAAASSVPAVALENPANGETRCRAGSVLVQKSGHVDDDVQLSAFGSIYEMDGRKSRYIGEVLEWYRGEDAGDLKRSEIYVFICREFDMSKRPRVEKNWKSDQKVVMDDTINPKILMDEKSWKTLEK